jgi:hypothetical protein
MFKSILFLACLALIASACAGPSTNDRAANTPPANSTAPINVATNSPAQTPAGTPLAAAEQSTPTSSEAIPFPDAPRIPLTQAKADFDLGRAVFIDTHNADTFDAEHIRGALNIMPSDLDAKINLIPKGKKIIVYCS